MFVVYISQRRAEESLRPSVTDKDQQAIQAENVHESDYRKPRKRLQKVADVLIDTAEWSICPPLFSLIQTSASTCVPVAKYCT